MKNFPAVILAVPFALLSCARGPEMPTGASIPAGLSGPNGIAGASAVGDVKTGPGDLEIFNVRLDRQDPRTGASILRQYANPGGVYRTEFGEQIEVWVEYRGSAGNPRVRIDWGAGGEVDGHVCGDCRFYRTYQAPGVYTVVVTVDDQAGTVVRRTFVLNSGLDEPAILNLAVTGSYCALPHLIGPGGLDCTPTGGTCSATFAAGSTVTLSFSGTPFPTVGTRLFVCPTYFAGWEGACSGVGTGVLFGTSASCTLTLPAGTTSATLKTVSD